jgi:hypothetical protein
MKAFLKRFKYVIASVSLVAGVVAPIVLTAGPAGATTANLYNDHTGDKQGFSQVGSTIRFQDNQTGTELELVNFGPVVDTGGQCWPFTCGNGLNAYFVGEAVYVIDEAGNQLPCATATNTGSSWQAYGTDTACGGGHLYSYFVGHSAWDGKSGSLSFANVGATQAEDVGEYLNSAQKGDYDDFSINCGTSCSYHT